MKKCSGCFSRILGFFIVLGIIGAAGLGYLSYEKANKAEAATTPVMKLREAYIGDTVVTSTTDLWEKLITQATGNSEIMQEITAALGDTTIAEMIVENYYLADDDTLSTTIAQKILAYRLSKAYTDEEILFLYSAIMGYAPMTAVNRTSHPGTDILADILEYLTDKNLIPEDTSAAIKNHLE